MTKPEWPKAGAKEKRFVTVVSSLIRHSGFVIRALPGAEMKNMCLTCRRSAQENFFEGEMPWKRIFA